MNIKKKLFKNLTIEVLDALLGTVESVLSSFDRKEAYRIINGTAENELTVANISKFFYSLKHRGYIETVRHKGIESFRFTNKTKLALVDKIAFGIKSDEDVYCFVSFDIPEILKRNRDGFRRTIKRMGFMQIQRSLWVCNKSLGNLVDMAAHEYSVGEYVVYLITDKTNINSYLKNILNSKFENGSD